MISIILLVYDEELTIQDDIEKISNTILSKENNCELIVVEDYSNESMKKKLKSLHVKYNFKLIHNSIRSGYKNSLIQGIESCNNENIFLMETGGKYDFKFYWDFKKILIDKKADIVSAHRTPRYDSITRRILTFSMNLCVRFFSNTKYRDLDSGFKIYKKEILANILENKLIFRNFFNVEILLKSHYLGKKIIEIEIPYFQRIGSSKQFNFKNTIIKVIYLIYDLKKLFKEIRPN